MEDIKYLNYSYLTVSQQTKLEFFKGLPGIEGGKVRTMYNTIKSTLVAPDKNIKIESGEGIYRFTIVSESGKLLGVFYYIPSLSRLDVYTTDNPNLPVVQIVKKQIVFKSYSWMLDKLGAEKLFGRLINVV